MTRATYPRLGRDSGMMRICTCLVEVEDDIIINDVMCDWQDDSVEIYLDAQNIDTAEYNPATVMGEPAYQFTAIAGNGPDAFCGVDTDTSAFNVGINSYNEDDATSQYPQGADTSVSTIVDETHWSFEVAFPWEALEETPDNILARGDMGFGIAVNDTDIGGARDTQIMWATELADLWHISASFPSVALSNETVGGGGKPKLQAGDADQDLDFDQLDLVQVQIAAKYLTGQAATWGEGDWNGAPGGDARQSARRQRFVRPAGHHRGLEQWPVSAGARTRRSLPGGQRGRRPDVDHLQRQHGRSWRSTRRPDVELTSINIDSAAGIFTGDPAENLGGSFDNDADNNIFKATFGSSFGSLSFGNVAQAGLSEEFVPAT